MQLHVEVSTILQRFLFFLHFQLSDTTSESGAGHYLKSIYFSNVRNNRTYCGLSRRIYYKTPAPSPFYELPKQLLLIHEPVPVFCPAPASNGGSFHSGLEYIVRSTRFPSGRFRVFSGLAHSFYEELQRTRLMLMEGKLYPL